MKTTIRKRRKKRIVVAGLLILAGIGLTMAAVFILLASPGGITDSLGIILGMMGCASFGVAGEGF